MDEKQLLEAQKDALRSDLANFKKEVIDKIKRDKNILFITLKLDYIMVHAF